MFYAAARKQDRSHYNKAALTSIRAATDNDTCATNQATTIVDSEFTEANKALNCLLKSLCKSVEAVAKLYEEGDEVDAKHTRPKNACFNWLASKRPKHQCNVISEHFFIIKIGDHVQASTKGQINVTPSLPKAYGYVPYLIVQRFLQIKLPSNFLSSRDPRHAVSTSLATLIKASLLRWHDRAE